MALTPVTKSVWGLMSYAMHQPPRVDCRRHCAKHNRTLHKVAEADGVPVRHSHFFLPASLFVDTLGNSAHHALANMCQPQTLAYCTMADVSKHDNTKGLAPANI
jgi:hypothetical protein